MFLPLETTNVTLTATREQKPEVMSVLSKTTSVGIDELVNKALWLLLS